MNGQSAKTSAQSLEQAAVWQKITQPAEPFLKSVQTLLRQQVQSFEPEIQDFISYALSAQGKQLRPALVALSANATGGVNESHISAAVIVEMVHLATLVHDDIMDDAELRRGRLTVASRWGNHLAVLAGDCLFAHALKLAAEFPTPEVCRVVASATNTVCSGEILQDRLAGQMQLTRPDYFRILQMKTGELFALSCDLGAFLTGSAPHVRQGMRRYGLALGTAYQIYDDCLDLFGSEREAGKSLGTDLSGGKLTLPLILTLEKASPADAERVRFWLKNWNPIHLPELKETLDTYQILPACILVAQEHLNGARAALSDLWPSDSRGSLIELADFLAGQMAALGDVSRVSV